MCDEAVSHVAVEAWVDAQVARIREAVSGGDWETLGDTAWALMCRAREWELGVVRVD